MGTRHLIAVHLDGKYPIAQYGQWDGYPGGQGDTVLRFLAGFDRAEFERKCRAAHWLTDEEAAAIDKEFGTAWARPYPHLSRNAGADILSMVAKHVDGIALKNSINFVADSLMCEWVYVIDLDVNTLEVFKGFNQDASKDAARFAGIPLPERRNESYHRVTLAASYPLSDLPTTEKMVADCDPPETEETEDAA